MPEQLDILVLCAHPDDAEISAAGTLIQCIRKGYKVGIVDLTMGELGTRGSGLLRIEEAKNASTYMGLTLRENLNLGDGSFQNDHATRLKVIECLRRYRPKIVLTNSKSDRHPDHGKGAELVVESCFYSGLSKLETTSNGVIQEAWRPTAVYHFIQDYYHEPDFVMDITSVWDQKVEALKCYSSQFFDPSSQEPRTPISGEDFFDFLNSRARELGRAAGMTLAEGFVSARRIGVKDFFDLV
jgi:bacillithiol biosynthesis deacetylase BshB1